MSRVWRWLTERSSNKHCPVCGRGVGVVSHISGVGGQWDLPVARAELIAACRLQNGTDHGDDDPPEPSREERLPSLRREAAVGFGVGAFFLVLGAVAAAWGFALWGAVLIAGTIAFLVRRSREHGA